RMDEWISEQRSLAGRLPRRYNSIEDAFRRMQEENPHLTAEQARHLTVHGANQNEDGTYSWKFDNYVRAWPPYDMPGRDIQLLWSRITCPTLLLYGKESRAGNPAADGRVAHFHHAEVVGVDGAGHWLHHDRLAEFLRFTFMMHGSQKLLGAFGGGGLAGVAGMLSKLGVEPAQIWAWVLSITEFVGGVCVFLGFLARFWAAGLVIDMAVAIFKVHIHNGFFAGKNGFELPLA